MVLSNKKLKQKLRAAKAELLASNQPISGADPDSKTDENILKSVTQKPKLSKREKRREKAQSLGENLERSAEIGVENEGEDVNEEKAQSLGENGANNAEIGGENEGSGSEEEKKKRKKRKRGDEDGVESEQRVKPEAAEMKKTKKKKKKQKKKKQKKSDVKNAEGDVNQAVQSSTQRIENAVVSTKVYVGGIPYYSNEDDIRSYFEGCGTITEIDCMTFPDSDKFRGIAIINFKTEAAAKRALSLDGSDMGGLFLKIQPYNSSKANKTSNFSPEIVEGYNRIYVGNLSWDITKVDLKNLFSNCHITSIRFGEDKETGEFKGYAHVDFADHPSLTNALKLDQKIVYGRPVRISAAVPKKGAVIKSGTPRNSTQEKSVYNPNARPQNNELETQSDQRDSVGASAKIKRRTCYECGERGHLSSACPKKQETTEQAQENGFVSSTPTPQNNQLEMTHTNQMDTVYQVDETQSDRLESVAVSSKIKRRTCYECGERGHLSSSCPKKQATEEARVNNVFSSTATLENDQLEMTYTNQMDTVNQVDETQSAKIKRRTCYECGERGHLSSSCPKKQETAEHARENIVVNSTPTQNDQLEMTYNNNNNQMDTVNQVDETQRDLMDTVVASSKIKRRTCYECGGRGHLSSSCPKKQKTAEQARENNIVSSTATPKNDQLDTRHCDQTDSINPVDETQSD